MQARDSKKVSVLMITYNHDKYISQALESVLMQEVDFDYEIVIGEDCSTDNTRTIILDYQRRYPDRFHLLLRDRNLGMVRNFMETYVSCKTKYIAVLDGDDYWVSPRKLQRQVEFLDGHPDFTMCFHPVKVCHENGRGEKDFVYPMNPKQTYSLEDLLKSNFIPFLSVVYRNDVVRGLPAWFGTLNMTDWQLHVLHAEHGKIGCLNETMGVYRQHAGGVWTTLDPLGKIRDDVGFFECMKSYLVGKHRKIVKTRLAKKYYQLASLYMERDNRPLARKYLRKSLIVKPFDKQISSTLKIKMALSLYSPLLYQSLKKGRSLIR